MYVFYCWVWDEWFVEECYDIGVDGVVVGFEYGVRECLWDVEFECDRCLIWKFGDFRVGVEDSVMYGFVGVFYECCDVFDEFCYG